MRHLPDVGPTLAAPAYGRRVARYSNRPKWARVGATEWTEFPPFSVSTCSSVFPAKKLCHSRDTLSTEGVKRVCFGRKPGNGKTGSFLVNFVPKFSRLLPIQITSFNRCRQPMAICRRLPTFPDWPCDELGRLHLGVEIGNKLTSLYGRSGRHG